MSSDPLLQPYRLKHLTLKNRLMITSHEPASPEEGISRFFGISAWIRLASTAKPSPPTSPSAMQRRDRRSNTCRSRSLSRNRPCRFFEKVEWSGTRRPGRAGRTTDRPG